MRVSNYLEKEISELRKEIADELGYTRKDRIARRRAVFLALGHYRKILILGGACLVLLIAFFALYSGTGNKRPPDKVNPAPRATLSQLEQKIARLEGIGKKIELLEARDRELNKSLAELNRMERLLNQRVERLTQVVDDLQNSMSLLSGRTEQTPTAPAEDRSYVEAPPTITRMPFSLPETRHHEVRPGDTLYSIAQRYSLTVDELCRLNKMTPRQIIHPGQELLVASGSNQ